MVFRTSAQEAQNSLQDAFAPRTISDHHRSRSEGHLPGQCDKLNQSRQKRRDWQFEIPSLTWYAANSIHTTFTTCTPRQYRGATNEDVPETSWCPPKHQSIFIVKRFHPCLNGKSKENDGSTLTPKSIHVTFFVAKASTICSLHDIGWVQTVHETEWQGPCTAFASRIFKNYIALAVALRS